MSLKLIDTHAHVQFSAFESDQDQVVQHALDQGIGMVVVGTQTDTSLAAVKLAERYENVWAAVGLHPSHLHAQPFHDAQESIHVKTRAEIFDPEFYATLAKSKKVVAIGEFGLDYYRLEEFTQTPDEKIEVTTKIEQIKAQQQLVATAHLRLATRLNLPVVIHCRDAHADLIVLIKQELATGGLTRRGILHCFTGTPAEAKQYTDLGFYISFSGIVTFGANVQATALTVPLDKILVETDSPYLAPIPNRGKRNEPANVAHVAQFLAKLRSLKPEVFYAQLLTNTKSVFKI